MWDEKKVGFHISCEIVIKGHFSTLIVDPSNNLSPIHKIRFDIWNQKEARRTEECWSRAAQDVLLAVLKDCIASPLIYRLPSSDYLWPAIRSHKVCKLHVPSIKQSHQVESQNYPFSVANLISLQRFTWTWPCWGFFVCVCGFFKGLLLPDESHLLFKELSACLVVIDPFPVNSPL